MAEKAISTYSYDAYLALEAEPEVKYEYHDGFIVAMAGGTPAHSQICANFIWAANDTLRNGGKSCIVHTSDLKVRVMATNRTYYPDSSIVCEQPEYGEIDRYALINPLLILEVLSENTVAFDRGAKFTHYRAIPSLKEYVLISQDDAVVDTYYRVGKNTWEIHTWEGLDTVVELKSIGCSLQMNDIYRLVPGIAKA